MKKLTEWTQHPMCVSFFALTLAMMYIFLFPIVFLMWTL